MSEILVTGGAGYIGSHTAVELAHSGFTPVILDNFMNSDPMIVEGLHEILGFEPIVYKGDCNDWNVLTRILDNHNLEGIIHFAAFKSVPESTQKPLEYYYNNVNSLINILKMMNVGNINNIVFSSSSSVYGEPDELPVTELSPIKKAESPYGTTKQVCEQILDDYISGKPGKNAISLRYFNPIGAHASGLIGELPLGIPDNLVPYITQTASGVREKLLIFGNDYPTPDGTCIRDYIHVVDVSLAHISALEYLRKQDKLNNYDVINIGTGKGESVMEIVKKFERVSGRKLNHEFSDRRPGDVIQVFASVDKAKKILGWSAELTIEQALADAWKWQQNLPIHNK